MRSSYGSSQITQQFINCCAFYVTKCVAQFINCADSQLRLTQALTVGRSAPRQSQRSRPPKSCQWTLSAMTSEHKMVVDSLGTFVQRVWNLSAMMS